MNFVMLSMNTHPDAVAFLTQYPDCIYWWLFSQNPTAIEYIRNHLDEVAWDGLCRNPHLNALEILQENYERIDWFHLSTNPNIFEYDYDTMRQNCGLYEREFVERMMHPKNYDKFEDWGFI
jgi:hypothetical protein